MKKLLVMIILATVLSSITPGRTAAAIGNARFSPVSDDSLDNTDMADTRELNMLYSVGNGIVVPEPGKHDFPLGQDIRLGAIPSSTWYAFDLTFNLETIFAFDPWDSGNITAIGTYSGDYICGGTWADGKWHVINYYNRILYTVNPSDGTMTIVGSTGQDILSGIAYDEVNDIMYASSKSHLFTLNRSTGATTLVGPFGPSLSIVDIAYGDGVLYAHCKATDAIYTVNVSTGAATLLGPTGFDADYSQGMEYDKDHGRLFLTLAQLSLPEDAQLIEIDKTNGDVISYFTFNGIKHIDGFAIPYGIIHPWEFDRWEVDGTLYSKKPHITLKMDANHTVQAFFSPLATLTMLAPGGEGTGSVIPAVGTHQYIENTTASIIATPYFSSVFSYWEVDDAYYSSNPDDTIVMSNDHTAKAFFEIDTSMICSSDAQFGVLPEAMTLLAFSDEYYDLYFADDFEGLGQPIVGIEFWGCEVDYDMEPCTKPSQNYIIRFFEYGPLPGNLVYEENVTMFVAPTTKYFQGDPSYGPIYRYAGMLSSPVTLTDGWFSVQAESTGICGFAWVDGGPSGSSYDCAYYFNDSWNYCGSNYDLSFCLIGTSSPPMPTSTPTPTNTPTPTTIPTNTPTPTQASTDTPTQPPTSTPTGAHTPPPTAPPTSTPTGAHTSTPTQPPTSTPTGAHTPTPTEPPEPTPTETPEPTPTYPLGVRLNMPDMAHPGDDFYVTGYLDNPDEPLNKVPTFFILEVYGIFWFWPSWAYFDYPDYTDIDYELIYIPTGTTSITVIPTFTWPDTGQDVVTGLGFYGAMLNPEMSGILGELAVKEWGYGPSR
ncbi:MAG: hypothetical protein WBM02_12180 [bacterium]